MKFMDADLRKARNLCVASVHSYEPRCSGMGDCNCINIAQALADERAEMALDIGAARDLINAWTTCGKCGLRDATGRMACARCGAYVGLYAIGRAAESRRRSNPLSYYSEEIAKVLEANNTLCMDHPYDRQTLAHALWDLIE